MYGNDFDRILFVFITSIYESHQICIFLKGFVHGYGYGKKSWPRTGVLLLLTVFFFHDILGEIGREQVFVDVVHRKSLFLDFKKNRSRNFYCFGQQF